MSLSDGKVKITGTATEDWEDFISFRVIATADDPSKVPAGYEVIKSFNIAIEATQDPAIYQDTSGVRVTMAVIFGALTGLFLLTSIIACICGCLGKCKGGQGGVPAH